MTTTRNENLIIVDQNNNEVKRTGGFTKQMVKKISHYGFIILNNGSVCFSLACDLS